MGGLVAERFGGVSVGRKDMQGMRNMAYLR